MCRCLTLTVLLASFLLRAEDDPHALLEKADRVRREWTEAVLMIRVTTEKSGAAPSTGRFEVDVKGNRSRIKFLEPGDAGRFLLTIGDDAFLLLPKTQNPIRVPKSHRLEGGFSAADLAKTRFAEEYDAVVERQDDFGGRPCDVLRLMAKKGRNPTYPVARVWIDRKEGLYRKAVFLLASGKTAKDTTFDGYKPYRGILALESMTIVDTLRTGKTKVEYLDYEKKSLPDSLFDLKTAREH